MMAGFQEAIMADFDDARSRWNTRYMNSDGFLFGTEPNRWLEQHAALIEPGMKVLSVADGEGRNAVFAASRGAQVVAFDLADAGVARAKQFAQDLGLTIDFRVADVRAWDWDAQQDDYDVVLAIFVQFAGPELRSAMFEGIRKVVKPGGLVIVEGYGPRQVANSSGGPGVLENMYAPDTLPQAFAGWHCVASRDQDADLAEGSAHRGLAHLVSAVYRKTQG